MTHANPATLTAHTAFLGTAGRHDLAAGTGLAELAMWYASEAVPFETSVAALLERAGNDLVAVRVAHDYLAFEQLSPSTHGQVMALFMVNDLLRRIETARGPKGGLARVREWGRRRSASAGRWSGRPPTWGR